MKTPTTWRQVVKDVSKTVPKGSGLKAILPLAKKEWNLIKSGKHATKMVANALNVKNLQKTSKRVFKKRSRRKSKRRTKRRSRK